MVVKNVINKVNIYAFTYTNTESTGNQQNLGK